MSINRRNVLIGSAAALAIGACAKKTEKDPGCRKSQRHERFYSDGLPDGDNPSEGAYAEGQGRHGRLINFSTRKICLIYMDITLNPFALDVVRVHFDNDTEASDWAGVSTRVTEWIERLNSGPFPTEPAVGTLRPWHLYNNVPPNNFWLGLNDLAFNQQHHVIAYFKTSGIDIEPVNPIWFGESLQGLVLGHGDEELQADPNYSFYGAARQPLTLTNPTVAGAAIYMRNHYQRRVIGGYRALSRSERRVYSLNMNIFTHTKVGNLKVPIVLDPDTGNMGEGQP